MRFLLAAVLLVVTGYGANGWNTKKVLQMEKLNGRQIRAATTCTEAYEETLEPQFLECQDYLTPESNGDYTSDQLDKFCQLRCIQTVAPVYRDIGRLCHDSVSIS